MGQLLQPARPRVFLYVERLEDRSNPAADFSDLIATGAFAPDRVLVTFAEGAAAGQLSRLAALPAAGSVTPLGFGIYRVNLRPNADLPQAVHAYAALPDVATAGPDRVVKLDAAALNDPSLSSQYALTTTGVTAAWGRTTGTKATIVAVIDTGIDYAHPDLATNMWVDPGEIPGNGRDDDGDGYVDDVYGYDFANNDGDPMDDGSHGTHVAGIVGAVGNNGVGVAGVDPNTRLMALKFIKGNGEGYTSDAVRALDYAVAHGARVANASWGGGDYDATLAAALGRARAAGVIVVGAAGNDSKNDDATPFYPGSYATQFDNVVAVAATDSNDNLAGFSNYGAASVTLAAPGVNVLSTLPNGRYGNLSGTSMATPFVTGAIALLWDANPTLTYRQVIDKLKASVDPVTSLAGKTVTGGRLNVARMLDVAVPAPPPAVPPPPASPPPVARDTTGAKVTAAVFSGAAANTFDRVRVTFNKKINAGSFTAADVTLTGPGGAFPATAVIPVAGTNNTQFDVTFAPRSAPGTYTVVLGVDVFDIPGNRLNQNGNAVNGEAGDRFTGTGTLAVTDTSSAAGGNLPAAIPDAGTVEIPIAVTAAGTVAAVTLTVTIEHANVGDLTLQLRAPTGQTVTLVERRGGAGSGFRGTTFDAAARTLISKAPSPFAGSYRPEEPFAGLVGLPAAGTWTLVVRDGKAGNVGTVRAVSLDLTTTPPGAAASTSPPPAAKPTLPPATEPKVLMPRAAVAPSAVTLPVIVVPTAVPLAELRTETRQLVGYEPAPLPPPDMPRPKPAAEPTAVLNWGSTSRTRPAAAADLSPEPDAG